MGKCLKNGDTRSCGCLLNEVIAKGGGAYKHGGSPTKNKPNRLYGIWAGMLNRCYNRNNKAILIMVVVVSLFAKNGKMILQPFVVGQRQMVTVKI